LSRTFSDFLIVSNNRDLHPTRSKRSTEQQAVSTLQQQKLDLTSGTGDLLVKKRELETINKNISALQKEKLSLEDASTRLEQGNCCRAI